jgi:hypothetical protein
MGTTNRTDPRTVTSPVKQWTLIEVLHGIEPPKDGGNDWALAIGRWDGDIVLAQRWNCDPSPLGMPNARGFATWYVIPSEQNEMFANSRFVKEDRRAFVRALLDLPPAKQAA